MRGNAGEKGELLSPSFAGITLIRFYGYNLSPDIIGHPGNFVAAKLAKKAIKSVTFWHFDAYYSKFNYYEENIYSHLGRSFNYGHIWPKDD